MKITSVSNLSMNTAQEKAAGHIGTSFQQVRQNLQVEASPTLFGPDTGMQLRNLEHIAMSGGKLTPAQLITYQIKAGDFGLRVQLVSKVAESAVSTLKRLQNPQ